MNKNFKLSFLLVLVLIAGTACNLPAAGGTEEPALTSTPTLTPEAATDVPVASQEAADCVPTVTTTTDANVRGGPGLGYGIYGVIPQNGTADVDGKNAAGDWWYIKFAAGQDGHGWIAGSVTTATCIPDTLAIITAPPLPAAAVEPTVTKEKNQNNNNDNSNDNSNSNSNDSNSNNQPPIFIIPNFPLKPADPSNAVISKKCTKVGNNQIFPNYDQTNTFTWKDNAGNETGYKIYRDGALLTTTGANVQVYIDTILNQSPKIYIYGVAATNVAGDSNVVTVPLSMCGV